ncbi:elongation factor P [Candidatus Falkowbacteria bacterium HGW-Falkowbacteria-1]|jgi:elongation factor P|uniref:Elongation factor P n=1 Tax=Candidatus Falkowbacteria bacterium HGW-Falkowbacteria-1 TaxID=2013768 RepID=A0A2N2E8U0_9BACT|nr:MAG: elongation factor P [Candidatus Falkowbacteria bacterium HGW-Falkowbacteria-1]
MLSLNEIKTGKVLDINNEPYIIVKTDHHKTGRSGAVLKVKMKNLINGTVLEKTYQGSDKAEEAKTETKKANFMYKDQSEAYFMDNTSFEQFSLSLEDLGSQEKYLKEETDVDVLYFNDNPVSISLPIKMDFKVVSAPPGVKGNSSGNVNKQVELETGAMITVPLFINEGDVIRINTDTEEYVERA